jgi:hypothetical protein
MSYNLFSEINNMPTGSKIDTLKLFRGDIRAVMMQRAGNIPMTKK